jgi:putative transposase
MKREALLPEKIYHIINHANGSENLFRSNENYRYFLEKYTEYIYPIAETYAYCLMPNHFHLMVKIRSEADIFNFLVSRQAESVKKQDLTGFENLSGLLSQQFSHFFNAYTKAYNKMYDRRGSLFERAFKRKSVETEAYFTQLIVYVHLNPIKHGFCKDILDWPYSSIHAYYLDKSTKINRQYLQNWCGNKQGLIEFHKNLDIDDLFFDL